MAEDTWKTCPAGAYERTITVRPEDVQENGFMRLGALVREMQTTGCKHLETLGLGSRSLMPQGYLWMLIRTSMEITRLPRAGETLLLRDWYGAAKHWMYPGRYMCFAEDGTVLARAVSQWMLVDANTRTLTDPPALMDKFPAIAVEGERALPARRVSFPELTEKRSRTVSPEEIDFNGHMNNAHYLDWGVSLWEREGEPAALWVEYAQELMEGQAVPLRYAREGNPLYVKGYSGAGNVKKIRNQNSSCHKESGGRNFFVKNT